MKNCKNAFAVNDIDICMYMYSAGVLKGLLMIMSKVDVVYLLRLILKTCYLTLPKHSNVILQCS